MSPIPLLERFYRTYLDEHWERIIPGQVSRVHEMEHRSRYAFAAQYVTGRKVLDAACGVGYGSRQLLDSGAAEVLALDASTDALAFARANYETEGLTYREARFPPLPVPDRSFDVITAFEIIEHLEEDRAFVKDASRAVKQDGVFLISTPNKAYSSPGWDTPPNRFHVREYMLDEFRELCTSAFPVVDIFGQTSSERLKEYHRMESMASRLTASPVGALRKMLPPGVRRRLRRGLIRAGAGPVEESVSIADYVISRDRLKDAEVFIAVCRLA